MGIGANVESLEVLSGFKISLVKFTEVCIAAFGDAEGDVNRTIHWLESDQMTHWNVQIRHCQEALSRAEEALRQKKIFKDSSGRTASAVEEMKMVNKAKMHLEEAQQKLANTKRWLKQMQKEAILYKGAMGRFQGTVAQDVPAAVGHLNNLLKSIQDYLAVKPGAETPLSAEQMSYFGAGAAQPAMARGKAAGEVQGKFANFRARSPSVSSRDAVQPATEPLSKSALPEVTDAQRQGMQPLQVAWATAAGGDKVLIDKTLPADGQIMLERARNAPAGDSGWYIGAAVEAPATEMQSVTLADLLALRPDWQQMLSLPPGCMVVLGNGGMAAILSETDENLFSPPAPAKEN